MALVVFIKVPMPVRLIRNSSAEMIDERGGGKWTAPLLAMGVGMIRSPPDKNSSSSTDSLSFFLYVSLLLLWFLDFHRAARIGSSPSASVGIPTFSFPFKRSYFSAN